MSSHLYHGQRLSREHLLEIAAHGFETLELFATRTHFDYHNPSAVADLQQWLADAGLELHGIHAPISGSFLGGRWGAPLTLASADPEARAHAMAEAERALHVARRISVKVLVAQKDKVLVIPKHLVQVGKKEATVAVKGPKGLDNRRITLGIWDDARVEVTGGLSPGDRILVRRPPSP